ncbi:coiled-coil domain-containing protein 40 [Diachasma alloeum]|uniref:coiled-coil domain-containing protein 40 n=1 Tax=Diachasma alloeum TaxID=454923 RepID=UPI0010FB0EE7|nr:coiled-coil domain-containing protein 40 [Diachasma alloeum]
MTSTVDPDVPQRDVDPLKFKSWRESESSEMNENKKRFLKVLDPDDPLMRRFQDALRSHLLRVEERLSAEIAELNDPRLKTSQSTLISQQAANKEASRKREEKGMEMYEAQREISRQQTSIEKYAISLEDLKNSREEKQHRLKEKKELRNKTRQEADEERRRVEELSREMESLSSRCKRFEEFEEEVSHHLTIAKRMSEKDASVQRELIRQKQQEDYLLLKLSEEIWKLEREIEDLRRQQEAKSQDKIVVGQTISDADADLGALQRERKGLLTAWNRVVANILQRDKITEELSAERSKIRESFKTLQVRIEKTKKDTAREMETNEKLTGLQTRLEEDIRCNQSAMGMEKDKADVLEYKTLDVAKMLEKTEADYDAASFEFQELKNEERSLDKELETLGNEKTAIEEELITKLSDKVTHDKTAVYLNKIVREAKETVNQFELTMLQTENHYGRNLLELEKMKNFVATEKEDLEELSKGNILKEKELNKLKMQIERSELSIEKKQKKIADLNRDIAEITRSGGALDMTTQDLKIASLEKRIEELDLKNQESQKYWLRQEGNMVNLSQERNTQLQELSRLSRQITIMEQKNLKLEYALEKEKKDEDKIDRRMKELRQRLLRTNSLLAERKELRNNLLDKNFITQDEYVKTLKEAEVELVRLQTEIKELKEEKVTLEERLCDAHREYFSWEKKMKLAVETSRVIKEERNTGGDIAIMKSEIHKMEMRLSHLRKVQEKMIRDMEYCIARREVIIDGALAREKKNPKGIHNKRVMMQKRMDDRRMKIKQVIKDTKTMENTLGDIKTARAKLQAEIDEKRTLLKSYQDAIPDIDRQISEGELLKHHKLECLVRKQRKVRMLQKVRDGQYKMLFKSETALNDELEKQRATNIQLSEIMEETNRDFPHLKEDIRKIILTIQAS